MIPDNRNTTFEQDLESRWWNRCGLYIWTGQGHEEKTSMTRHLRVVRSTFAVSLYFLCYTMIAMACINLLQPCHEICHEVDGTGLNQDCKQYLRADYNTECGTTSHKVHMGFAVVFVIMYNLTIPGWFVYTLWTHKSTLKEVQDLCDSTTADDQFPNNGEQLAWVSSWSRDVALAWRSMYRNYRRIGFNLGESQYLYLWEAVRLMQSFFLVAILRLLLIGSIWQLILGLVFIQVTLYIECSVSPHRDRICNFVSRMGHVTLSVCLVVGLVLWATERDYFDSDQHLLATKFAAPVLLCTVVFFYVVVLALLLLKKCGKGPVVNTPVEMQAQQRGPSHYYGAWPGEAERHVVDNQHNTVQMLVAPQMQPVHPSQQQPQQDAAVREAVEQAVKAALKTARTEAQRRQTNAVKSAVAKKETEERHRQAKAVEAVQKQLNEAENLIASLRLQQHQENAQQALQRAVSFTGVGRNASGLSESSIGYTDPHPAIEHLFEVISATGAGASIRASENARPASVYGGFHDAEEGKEDGAEVTLGFDGMEFDSDFSD